MSPCQFKKVPCRPVNFKKVPCHPGDFKKVPCHPGDFKKVPCPMLLRPKKGCVALSILGVYTHKVGSDHFNDFPDSKRCKSFNFNFVEASRESNISTDLKMLNDKSLQELPRPKEIKK